jgi:proline iminopeptidase
MPEPDAYGRPGRLVDVVAAQLYVVEVGDPSGYPIVVLHGGPGMDHHEFADYLDPLAERGYRLILVDQRASGRSPHCDPKTWTLETMAEDVVSLARSMVLERYAVFGHSYGAFVALQNAVDFPRMATQTIVCGGIPSAKYLVDVEKNLAAFEPEHLRAQVAASWDKESSVATTAGSVLSPDVLRTFAANDYGSIEVEDRLADVQQPVLILAGRHDRTCTVKAAEAMAKGIPGAELVVFEHSGHVMFVEEQQAFLDAVEGFLTRHGGA